MHFFSIIVSISLFNLAWSKLARISKICVQSYKDDDLKAIVDLVVVYEIKIAHLLMKGTGP